MESVEARWALLDGKLVKRGTAAVDIEDRAHQFGDGVYEVVRYYGGKAFRLSGHARRFARSLDALRIHWDGDRARLERMFDELAAAEGIADGYVYVQASRGQAKRVHFFPEPEVSAFFTGTATAMPRPVQKLRDGVSVVLAEDIRWLRCDIKSLNLLGAVLAKQEAHEAGCYEAVLHRGKTVTEGSSSNILIVKDGRLVTHPADNLILAGITRQAIIEHAGAAGIPVEERPFSVEELLGADEAIVSSTTSEAMPIVEARQGPTVRPIGNGKPGPLTRRIQESLEAEIRAL